MINPVRNKNNPNLYVDLKVNEERALNDNIIKIRSTSYPTSSFESEIDKEAQALYRKVLEQFSNGFKAELDEKYAIEINRIKDFKKLTEIPSILYKDPRLKYFICSMTSKPIRFIRIPNFKDKSIKVFYEKDVIEK